MDEKNTLYILWTNADPLTARLMVMMYAKNSLLRGWWEKVVLIVWGATAKLVAEDAAIQEELKVLQYVGVHVTACIACARELGVVERLQALDIEVVSWGPLLTDVLRNNEKLITI